MNAPADTATDAELRAFPLVYGKRLTDLEVLGRSVLLRGLSPRDIGTFLDALDQVVLPQGTTVIREGDAGEYMYFVLEGTGRLCRGTMELRTIGPGDHFGELAMLEERPRTATMEADTTMRLARLSRSRYHTLATSHPMLALHFTQAIARVLGDEVTSFTDSVGLLLHQRSAKRRVQVRVRRSTFDEMTGRPGTSELVVATGTLVGTLVPRTHDGATVVGATLNRLPAGLEAAVVTDTDLGLLTLGSAEGRAVLLRSATLMLLEAARRAVPGLAPQIKAGPTLENAQIILVPSSLPHDHPIDLAALAKLLDTELRSLVREGSPLREEVWALDEARADLGEQGASDTALLLLRAREATTTIARCGETYALSLGGPFVPRASELGQDFAVLPHPSGLLLRLFTLDPFMPTPSPRGRGVVLKQPIDPTIDEVVRPRYTGEMIEAGDRWLAGLGIGSVGAFNQYCISGGGTQVPELIRVAEGFHEKWIGKIADAIVARGRDLARPVKVIAIAGPSSSGKTTFIKRLIVQLRVDGIRPLAISLDDYYVDREQTPRDEAGEWDFEAIEAIDRALLQEHLTRLCKGEEVTLARYDFATGKSDRSGGETIRMEPDNVLLIEGIHGLNPALFVTNHEHVSAEGPTMVRDKGAPRFVIPQADIYRVFVHPAHALSFDRLTALAPEDVRLVRRLVRDRHQRSASAKETIARWPSVRRGELLHIFPFRAHADVVFDTSLVYELSVLKTYAERYLLEVPPSHASFTTASRLRRLLDHFISIHPDHVPPTSVIREFIGGSGFEY